MASALAKRLENIAKMSVRHGIIDGNCATMMDHELAPVREALKGSQCRSLPPSKRHDMYLAALASLNPNPPPNPEGADGK